MCSIYQDYRHPLELSFLLLLFFSGALLAFRFSAPYISNFPYPPKGLSVCINYSAAFPYYTAGTSISSFYTLCAGTSYFHLKTPLLCVEQAFNGMKKNDDRCS